METSETGSRSEQESQPGSQPESQQIGEEHATASGIQRRLGQLGRRIKRIDARSPIVSHPFVALGIAAGLGVVVGLVRPMPKRSRISGALTGALTAIIFRMVRDTAMAQLGQYARSMLSKQEGRTIRPQEHPGTATAY